LQSDPLGIEADQPYAYAANNPLVYRDPSGLEAVANVAGRPWSLAGGELGFSPHLAGWDDVFTAFSAQSADLSFGGFAQSVGYRAGYVLERTGYLRAQYDLLAGSYARTIEGSFLRDQAVLSTRSALPAESRALNQLLFPIEKKLAQGARVRSQIEAGTYPRTGQMQNPNLGVSAANRVFRVAGRTVLGASVAYGAYNVYAAPSEQRGQAALREAGGIGGALAGGFVGAEAGLLCGPGAWACSPVLGIGGAIGGGIFGEEAVDRLLRGGD
jgi:hypothetical protein